jgi:hypothetical protein
MSHQAFKANIGAIASAISTKQMEEMGATNVKMVSIRTLQFDLKTPRADGTNRIKITHEGGKFQVRGYKIEETDLIHSIEPDALSTAIKNIGTVTLPPTPTIY